jgi:hypothetical protein
MSTENIMKSAYIAIASLFALVGCATAVVGPGSEPSDTPPQMIKEYRQAWDNPSLFGEVPPSLEQAGKDYCRAQGYERADGYHPQALDENGDPYPGGGFFCVGEDDSSA